MDNHDSPEPEAEVQPPMAAAQDVIAADLIAKVNAGALLTFAVWSLPKDTVAALFRDAPAAFTKAYGAATEAYGVGGH